VPRSVTKHWANGVKISMEHKKIIDTLETYHILPLKVILLKRHIGTNDVCPLCQSDEEDILHMVFKCPGAANIWRVLGLEDTINQAMVMDRSGSRC
jgi:hypothetical protein